VKPARSGTAGNIVDQNGLNLAAGHYLVYTMSRNRRAKTDIPVNLCGRGTIRPPFVPLAIGALVITLGCNTTFGRTPNEGSVQSEPAPSSGAAASAPSAASPLNSGIYGSIRSGGGAAPGTSFHPVGTCVSVLDSAGALIAKADCNDKGEFRVRLPPGSYTVQGAGQTLQVRVTAGVWSTAYFRVNMR
jgi:hypothetical protein